MTGGKRTVATRAEELLARATLTDYLGVRPGETVTVESWSHALPWARALVVEARRIGAEPLLAVEDEEAFFRSLAALPRRAVPTAPAPLAAASDAYVYLGGPEALPRLAGLRPAERRALADRPDDAWRSAARKARMRVARLAIAGATPVAAERYGVDLDRWRRELVAASTVRPARLVAAAAALVPRLRRGRRIRVRHPNGTDLEAELLPRGVSVEDGRSARGPPRYAVEIPAGRVAIPLRRGSAHGRWEANRAICDRTAEAPMQLGARFRVQRGRLRELSFDRGGEGFAAAMASGGRGRDRVEALLVGLNPRIDRAPESADLALGAVSLVIGGTRGFGGRNGSSFSRSATLAEATLEVDGRPARSYQRGPR